MLHTAWILARKDLVLFFRDRTALALTLALPVLLATIFGSAMQGMTGGGGGGGVRKVKLVVEDRDGSVASAALVEALRGSDMLAASVTEDGRRVVANGDAPAALVIPPGYGATLDGGAIPEVALLRDPSQYIAQQALTFALLPALLQTTVERVGPTLMAEVVDGLDFPLVGREQAKAILRTSWDSMDELVRGLEAQGAFDDGEPDQGGEGEGQDEGGNTADGEGFDFMTEVPAFLGVRAEDVAGQDEDGLPRSAGTSHAIAAMAVMMLMFSLVAAGGTILEERDGGTLQRLLLAPAAGPAILSGKLLMLGLVGLLQLAVLFAYGWLVFDVPVWAHPLELALTSVGLVFAAVGLGLLFGVACTSRKQMEGLSTLVILVMSAVGGAWFPREVTPEWFQTAGLFTITAWAMDAFHGFLWYGKGLLPSGELEGIWLQLAVLYGIGAVLVGLSFRLFRRRFVLQA